MKKVRLGLCIGDNEYSLRFTNCIMNHYQEQVELHIYSENAELKRDRKSYDIVLIDDVKNAEKWGGEVPVLCLYDSIKQKPEWLTREQILDYKKLMEGKK